MVFEGILVDVLNRFLGPYVKNLDASQLRVGIWGGDVLLEKLDLKETALSDFNLPIRIFGGHLDKLRLKIPWSNLYSAPVVAEVDGLYVLAGPASAAKYDAKKAAKEQKDYKDKQLKKVAEARKKSAEAKEKKDEAPGFVEKLVTQIIKNVQVTVRNIHVTYEDEVTDPAHPFSMGVTLDSLFVQSTDSNYEVNGKDSDTTSQLIYKLVHMSCLAVYWNTDTELIGNNDLPEDWADTLKQRIARSHDTPLDIQYLLRPISAEAKLQLTMKPGSESNIPKALVSVVLEHISLSVGQQQYRNIMSLVESLDRMTINQKYLKYKPSSSSVREDPRGWWRYAITAVLEEDVKRKTQMWSWKHIKEHRARCKEYTELYVDKLMAKKLSNELKNQLEELEVHLDVLNITLCRQLAENKAERRRSVQEQEKAESGGGGWWAWSTSWVTGSSGDTSAGQVAATPPSEAELAKEKEKLYKALGYSEDGQVATYSKEYVAYKVMVDLKKVSVGLYNKEGQVSQLSAHEVGVVFMQRPAAGNISVSASLGSLKMSGRSKGEGEVPVIIKTKQHTGDTLLDVGFELKPLGRKADYSITAQLQPIQIVYDADTVDAIIGMFLLPKDVQLQKLSAAASSTIEEAKTQGRAGLEHSIGQKKILEMDILLHSPYVIVPENGTLTQSSTVLLLDLGSLHVTSDASQQPDSMRDASMEQLQAAFYDHFDLQLKDVQVIVAREGDDWEAARNDLSSPLHILQPTRLDLQLKKSLMDDTRLPKIKVSGELPSLTLSLSDKKIKQVLKIVQSLPLPPPSLASKSEDTKYSYEPSEPSGLDTDGILHSLSATLVDEEEGSKDDGSDDDVWYSAEEGELDEVTGRCVMSPGKGGADKKDKENISATKLVLKFDINEIGINFSEHSESSNQDIPRLDLRVTSVSASVQQRTWDMGVAASVGSLSIHDYYTCDKKEIVGVAGGVVAVVEGEPKQLLSTELSGESGKEEFLSVKFSKYDREGPQYRTEFSSTQQSIDVSLSLVKLQLHRESLANLLAIAKSITAELKSKEVKDKDVVDGKKLLEKSVSRISRSESKAVVIATDSKAVARIPGEKDLHLAAKLNGVEVTLSDHHGNLLTANVKGLATTVDINDKSITVTASLSDVALVDTDSGSCHPNVISRMDESQKVITATVVVFKDTSKKDLNAADLSVQAKVQRLKVTVLFRFLNRVKEFVSEFLSQLKLDQKTIDSAREAAAKTASRTAEALKEQSSSRVHLKVTIFAPVLVIPLSCLSQSALVADLGVLEVKNKFLLASSLPVGSGHPPESFLTATGQTAIVDSMEISISSLQLGRVDSLKDGLHSGRDHMILKPLKFSGVVVRSLSSWCKAVPSIDVQANLDTLEVQFSPDDFHALMSVVNSLNDGVTSRVPSTTDTKDEPTEIKPNDVPDSQTTQEEVSEKEVEGGSAAIRVVATVGVVKLLLHSSDGDLASISVEDLSTEVDLLSDVIQVKVGITDVNVSDLSSNSLFPKIVSVSEGAKALVAQIGVFSKATKSSEGFMDMTKCDMSVDASVGQLKFVLLFLFVNKLSGFLKEFQVSQRAIERAKKSAQESASAAVTAVQEQQKSGQRMKLKISLKAPEIVIPLRSDSPEVVVADLGVLKLENTFHCVKDWTSRERPPIFEKYCIELNDLQIYRTLLQDVSSTEQPHSLILEPFNLTLEMERNLSCSWYTDIPTIKLDAKLGNLKMTASDADIESLCLVVSGNLKEGSRERTTQTSQLDQGDIPVDAVEGLGPEGDSDLQPAEQSSSLSEEESVPESATTKVFKTIDLSAKLNSIEIELFKRESKLERWKRSSSSSLASLILYQFKASVCIESNSAMEVGVTMANCLLDDRRLKMKGKTTRLMEKVTDGESTSPLIDVVFTKSASGNSTVKCNVESVQVLLDLVFIFLLLDYLKTSVSSLSASVDQPNDQALTTTIETESAFKNIPEDSSVRTLTDSNESAPSTKKMEATKKEEDSKAGTMTIQVNVRRPLLALVENSEKENSRVLVFGTEIEFSMEQTASKMDLNACISDLSIFSTRMSNLQNQATKVLDHNKQPITACMKSTKGVSTDISVEVPNITLTLSPTTVRLILHVIHSVPSSDKGEEKEIGETSPMDLWEPKPVDTSSWYLNPPIEEPVNKEGTSVDVVPTTQADVFETSENLNLSLEGLTVLIEQDLPNCSAPVVAIKMGKYESKALVLNVENWTGQLNVTSELWLEASYYNLSHDAWEPLLEPAVNPEDEDQYMPWSLRASVYKNTTSTTAARTSISSTPTRTASTSSTHGVLGSAAKQDDLPPDISVDIISESPLLLTVTKTSLSLFKDLWSTYQEEGILEEAEETDGVIPETLEAVYLLKNRLGQDHPLKVTTKDTLKVHGAYSSSVQHGSTVPLHPINELPVLKPGEYLPRESYKKRRVHIVTLEVLGFKPMDVALGTSERVYYPLSIAEKTTSKKHKEKDDLHFGLVVDIARHTSQRVPVVTIRSPLQIVNNLKETMKVFWSEDLSDSTPPTHLTTLTGGSTHSLALKTTGSSTGGFLLQPDIPHATPSRDALMWKNKDSSIDVECYAVCRSIQGSSRCKPFFVHVTMDEEQYTKKPSISLSSRAHHVFMLKYPLILQTLVPLSVSVTENSGAIDTKELVPGEKTSYSHVVLSANPRFCTKIDYNGKIWSGEVTLGLRSSDYSTFTLKPETPTYSVDNEGHDGEEEEEGGEPGRLDLAVQKEEKGSWYLTLYCPYWIVNKTGLTLEYAGKHSDVVTLHHPGLPIALYPHKEVRVRVVGPSHQRSEWSKSFSLDAIGSEGIFQCIDKKTNKVYQMGTTVNTTMVGLGKLITISPPFLAYNQTRDEISFKIKGDDQEQVHTVKSKQLLPFWPPSKDDVNHLCVSLNDTAMTNPSKPFRFTENAFLLIKTSDKIPALVTEIQVTGSANVITFNPYYEGVVPVKIVNYMEYDVEFQQTSDSVHTLYTLSAGSSLLYTWDNPASQTKSINWRFVSPTKPTKMKTIQPKDSDGKFPIPRKVLPRSSSSASITSTTSSMSDWGESVEVVDGVDRDEWEDVVYDDLDGSSLYGIEETNEEPGSSDEDEQDSTDYSLAKGFKKFGQTVMKITTSTLRRKKRSNAGYWISFLDGLQRVILFTTSDEISRHVIGGQKTERANMDISLSLQEVGLSLVNDEKGLEVAYIGIPPSKPIWQYLKRWNRWKPVSNELKEKLEVIFDKQETLKREKNEAITGEVEIPGTKHKIDFSNEDDLMLIEKSGSKKRVRRSQFQGISVQVSLFEHLTSIETRINEVQIDNHLPFTSNPTILYAFPTPPTVASKYEPKPFIEGSLIMRKTGQSNVKQVQLLQVLVQEIGLNVDLNFILAIADLVAKLPKGQTEAELIETDMALLKLPLEKSKVEQVSAAAARNYFKTLHLSPLDIHLSFYLDRDSSYKVDHKAEDSHNPVFGAVLNAISQFAILIGRTKDAELKLGYFELDNVALTQGALMSRIQKHYIQQAAMQMYSIVLGLEVLGNPVGFIKGLKDGTFALFYHPIQGAVLGPGEFFEGLTLGGRQFFSGTLGGLSGAVGKVSGVLGDAAAKLTMDQEFQEKRRRRTGGNESVGRSLEGAAKGVLAGFTGVVTQPYKGAKKEGTWGAIKGLGKGVVGVFLRPTAGLLDLTSATFNIVQKKTKVGDSEVAQIRAARYIGPEMIVYPYSPHRSAGYALFMDVDNGRLADTDTFCDHVELVEKPLKVLLVTNKQLAVVKHNSIVNRFDDDFTVCFHEFTAPARVDDQHPAVIVMPVREETFGFGFISGKKNYKELEKTLTVLKEKIAKRSVYLINQSYEEFRTTASLSD